MICNQKGHAKGEGFGGAIAPTLSALVIAPTLSAATPAKACISYFITFTWALENLPGALRDFQEFCVLKKLAPHVN